jgi:predicted LPLAT superfamily acyltransferase
MQTLLDALNPALARSIIDAGQDGPALMLEIQQAVQSGALVALLVDRVHPGGPTLSAPFFGRPARFPTAPWLIAAVLKVPVALGFGLYRGGNRYELMFEAFADGADIPRAQRQAAVAALIQRYAARLEHHARSAPYNWFNFYDFWTDDDPLQDDVPREIAQDAAGGVAAGDGPGVGRVA